SRRVSGGQPQRSAGDSPTTPGPPPARPAARWTAEPVGPPARRAGRPAGPEPTEPADGDTSPVGAISASTTSRAGYRLNRFKRGRGAGSALQVADHGEHAAVGGVVSGQVELGEDRGDVLLHRPGGQVQR